jgi:hypothetical protein
MNLPIMSFRLSEKQRSIRLTLLSSHVSHAEIDAMLARRRTTNLGQLRFLNSLYLRRRYHGLVSATSYADDVNIGLYTVYCSKPNGDSPSFFNCKYIEQRISDSNNI